MKNFLVLLREPNGRTDKRGEEETKQHQQHWKNWLEKWNKSGHMTGGGALTLNGRIVRGKVPEITQGIRQSGTEIVGGYLLLKANSLDEAAEIIRSCPLYEFDGYAEVRELKS